MKRFLILALVGAWSLAGSTGLAFGANDGPQPGSKPKATKASPTPAAGKSQPSTPQTQAKKPSPPPPPKKHPPSKPPTQASKPPDHRKVVVDVPKGGPKPPAKKDPTKPGPAKPGNGSKPGKGSYSWDDYKRDLDKANQELRDGNNEELLAELPVAGAAIMGIPGGPPGILTGAGGAALANAPQLIDAKAKEVKGTWDGLSATGKFIGSWFNDTFKSKPRPKNAPSGTGR
jgi:hypothetical protein